MSLCFANLTKHADTTQLFRPLISSDLGIMQFLLFSGPKSIVPLFVLLFSQRIREDLVKAAYCLKTCMINADYP